MRRLRTPKTKTAQSKRPQLEVQLQAKTKNSENQTPVEVNSVKVVNVKKWSTDRKTPVARVQQTPRKMVRRTQMEHQRRAIVGAGVSMRMTTTRVKVQRSQNAAEHRADVAGKPQPKMPRRRSKLVRTMRLDQSLLVDQVETEVERRMTVRLVARRR